VQQARNLAGELGARMESLRFLLHDRDGKYGDEFDAVYEAEELRVMWSTYTSNAVASMSGSP
jgi:putative transposase